MPSRTRVTIAAVAAVAAVGGVIAAVALSGDDTTPAKRAATTTTGATSTSTTGAPTTTPDSTVAGAPTTAPSGLPTGRFTVVGRTIVDPDGNVFVPMGANMAVRQGGFEEGYAFNWNGTGTGHVADVQAWGWNTVRANLVCDLDGNGPSQAELEAGIDSFIEEYTSKRVVVMVECHDVTGDNLPPDSPKVQTILAFGDRLATRWKDNPYVWFNLLNEPQGNATAAGIRNWRALQTESLRRLRAIAPDSVFVADLPGSAQGLETLTGDDPVTSLGTGQCNVVYAWHAYGAVGKKGTFGDEADWDQEAASLRNHREVFDYLRDHDIPMVIGEVGDPLTLDEGSAGQPIWNRLGARAVISLAPEYDVGLIWWHATGDSGIFLTYSLMADRHAAPWSAATTGEGLSDGGRRFWEASKAVAARPPAAFTGDLSASACG